MAHKNVDVSCRHMIIGPYYRVIAHLDTGVGNISGLIDRSQYMHLVSGTLVQSLLKQQGNKRLA